MNDAINSDVIYEAALLQFTPRAASEERLNVGVVLYGPTESRILFRFSDSYRILRDLYPDLDGQRFRGLIGELRRRA